MKKIVRVTISFAIGCAVGLLLHYTLYRVGLPIKPFVYVSF